MDVAASPVAFSYTTILATKSRIDKGLLAIPVSLLDSFPQRSGSVYLADESGGWSKKSFTALDSTSKECRIGGMRDFYRAYDVKGGDELVLQVYGGGRYRLLPETLFRQRITQLESAFDEAATEVDVDSTVSALASLTLARPGDVIEGAPQIIAAWIV
jgi:hypothetical protein